VTLLVAAIETTGAAGSVALLRGETLLGEESLGDGTTHGAALHPALERLLRAGGATANDLGLVVAGTGPGSFTGMRVGVGAARSLSFAVGCPVVGVPSFDALAREDATVAVVRDARKGDVYFALYGPEGETLVAPCRRETAKAAASIPTDGLVLGEFREEVAALAKARGVRAGSAEESLVRASILGRLGLRAFLRDGAPPAASVLPLYLQAPLAVKKGEGVRSK
jgi:tRNA threonylcarbamoyladenosine biosynthesis protein TsaB